MAIPGRYSINVNHPEHVLNCTENYYAIVDPFLIVIYCELQFRMFLDSHRVVIGKKGGNPFDL